MRDFQQTYREIVLPFRNIGIGLREALCNREPVLISFRCACEIALRLKHAAYLAVRDREVAPPAHIVGVGLREALKDNVAVSILFERGFKVALLLKRFAYLFDRHPEVALPIQIVGVGLRERRDDVVALSIGLIAAPRAECSFCKSPIFW